MKIMGIDYGDARTGVAISDLLCTLVGSATVVPSRNTEKAIADIVRLAQENQVGEIVVGLPKNMDGTEGVRAELCREFADKLAQATGLPVSMWDERRTTVEAHNILSQHNYHGKKRKNTGPEPCRKKNHTGEFKSMTFPHGGTLERNARPMPKNFFLAGEKPPFPHSPFQKYPIFTAHRFFKPAPCHLSGEAWTLA